MPGTEGAFVLQRRVQSAFAACLQEEIAQNRSACKDASGQHSHPSSFHPHPSVADEDWASLRREEECRGVAWGEWEEEWVEEWEEWEECQEWEDQWEEGWEEGWITEGWVEEGEGTELRTWDR